MVHGCIPWQKNRALAMVDVQSLDASQVDGAETSSRGPDWEEF